MLVATYSYYHNGLRKSKTVNRVTTNFHWDILGNLVRESDASGNTIASYRFDPSGRLLYFYKTGYEYSYNVRTNLRGDVVGLVNNDNVVTTQYKYDPWGKITSSSGSVSQPFRYAGYYYDEETGLYYCKSRYYSPTLGRFLTKDGYGFINPAAPQSLNLYSYCRNNPVNFSDPTGHWLETDDPNDFTPEETEQMNQLGEAWWAAETDAERDAIHEQANAIRAAVNDRLAANNSIIATVGNAVNTIADNTYANVNLSTGVLVGTQKGLYISKNGVKPYVGAFGGGGASFSVTFGNMKNYPSPGLSKPSINAGIGFVVFTTDKEVGLGIGAKLGGGITYVCP